jgi:hypothetical protein
MIAMNYQIKLPADYDMEIIKNRVRNNGYKTDGFQDLFLKAYLIAEKGQYRNIQNEYSPFYVWNKTDGMNSFLLDGPFNSILDSFGWTQVNTWNVLHQHISVQDKNQYAVIFYKKKEPKTDFSKFCKTEKQLFLDTVGIPNTTAYIIAYNPTEWKTCHFLMSTDVEQAKENANNSLVYELYHLSQ